MLRTILSFGLIVALAVLAPAAWADDTEIFGAGLIDIEPNILIIFDNSGSMDGTVEVPVVDYDPAQTYSGSYSNSRVYYSTFGLLWFSFENIGSDGIVQSSEIACDSAREALNTFGYWTGHIYTTGSHNCSSWASTRMLRMGNYRNYLSSVGSGYRRKIDIAKDVVKDIIDTTPGVRFGLMAFNEEEGGHLRAAIKTRTTATERNELKNKVDGLSADTWTPLAETLAEAGLYYARQSSWFNAGVDYGNLVDQDGDGAADEYAIQWRCQKNYIVLMTDGASTEDRSAYLSGGTYIGGKIIGDYDNDVDASDSTKHDSEYYWIDDSYVQHSYSSSGSDYLDDVAAFLYTEDLLPGSLYDSGGISFDDPSDTRFQKQNIVTYTVGFDEDNKLLNETADADHGQGDYFTTRDNISLTEIFQNIMASIQQSSAEFVAPVVPVNRINRTYADNGLYLGIFSTDGTGVWKGNLKKFGLSDDGEILDRHGNAATGSSGYIVDGAHSCWGTEVVGTEGMTVSKGGAGAVLLSDITRTFLTDYTDTATNLTSLEAFSKTNTHITASDLNAADATEKDDLIDFARAEGIYAPTATGETDEPRTWILGDILHSRPAILYDFNNNRNVIFVGANDGFLHCFVDYDQGSDDLNDDQVEEAWAFIPWELLAVLPSLPPGDGVHDYFVDGTPVVYEPTSGTDHVTVGLRRGGNRYYTLDVSTYTSPTFAWEIAPTLLGTDSSTGNPLLGQSWCTPRFRKLRQNATDYTGLNVLLLTGGYDENQDQNDPGSSDNAGQAVYAVSAANGTLYSGLNFNKNNYTNLVYCMVDLTSFDDDDDGFEDTIYAGSLGGDLFTFDDRDENGTWQARRLFQAVNSGTDQLRKFFNAPSIVQEIGPIEYVYIGTGDREDPTRTTVVNQFYAVKNTWPATWSDATNTILSSSLVDLTSDTLQDSSASTAAKAAVTAALDTGAGWRIDMEHSGEKVVSSPVVFDKVVYFTTFTPSAVSGSGDKCSSNTASGTARLYAMDYKTGVSVVDWDNDDTLEKSDRSVVIGGGIPSEPVVVVTESGVQLMIGTQGGVKTIDLEYDNDFCRYYWREL